MLFGLHMMLNAELCTFTLVFFFSFRLLGIVLKNMSELSKVLEAKGASVRKYDTFRKFLRRLGLTSTGPLLNILVIFASRYTQQML